MLERAHTPCLTIAIRMLFCVDFLCVSVAKFMIPTDVNKYQYYDHQTILAVKAKQKIRTHQTLTLALSA